MENKNIAGEKIKISRLKRKTILQQKDLIAKMQLEGIHMSKNILSRIENNQRYITDIELKAFAKVLDVSISWLLYETDKSV